MRVRTVVMAMACLVCSVCSVLAAQPRGISLNVNGVSYIYPVFDSRDWLLTQPAVSKLHVFPDSGRLTHWADDYYAQDWARGCGATQGQRVYAGISGQIIQAGPRGAYGNTVVVHDKATGFALKYSHLSEISVVVGELVLAGKSLLGRVGNTGNIQSSGCSSSPGAHLHLVLHKNVSSANARPISSTVAVGGIGPSEYAASFAYAAGADLMKVDNDPTVYALHNNQRWPVSAMSFQSHGWGFDKSGQVFNPLAGRVWPAAQVTRYMQSVWFWPARDGSTIRPANQPTVYQFEDGIKKALSYNVFVCRNLRFEEVSEIPAGERDRYQPTSDQAASGCVTTLKQSLSDWNKFAGTRPAFQAADLATYTVYTGWDKNWELRSLSFAHSSRQTVMVYISSSIANATERYVAYQDPVANSWTGWQRIY